MNLFDIIVIAVISLSTIVGFFRGFVYLSIGFVSFICSIYFAYILSPFVEPFVLEYLKNNLAARISSGVISYILSTIFFAILSSQVKLIVKDVRGGLIDRLFGLVLGFTKGVFISLGAVLLISVVSTNAYVGASNLYEISEKINKEEEYPKFLISSLSYPFLSSIINFVGHIIPKNMLEKITIPTRGDASSNLDLKDSTELKDSQSSNEDTNIIKDETSLEAELEEFLTKKMMEKSLQ